MLSRTLILIVLTISYSASKPCAQTLELHEQKLRHNQENIRSSIEALKKKGHVREALKVSIHALETDSVEWPAATRNQLLMDAAELELMIGRPKVALEWLSDAALTQKAPGNDEASVRWHVLKSQAFYLLGLTDSAYTHARTALKSVDVQTHTETLGLTHLVLSEINLDSGNMAKGNAHLKTALALAQKSGNEWLEAEVLSTIGMKFTKTSLFEEYALFFKEARRKCIRNQDKFHENMLALSLSNFFRLNENIDSSLHYAQVAYKVSKAAGYIEQQANSLLCISRIYAATHDSNKGYEFALASKKLSEIHGFKQLRIRAIMLVGLYGVLKHDYSKTIVYYDSALALAKSSQYNTDIVIIMGGLARTHYYQHQNEKAVALMNEALRMSEEISTPDFQKAELWLAAGQVLRAENFERAEKYLIKAIELGESIKTPRISYNGSLFLYLSYKQQGRYEKALQRLEQLSAIKDSLNSAQLHERTEGLKVTYETKQKELELASMKREKEVQDLTLAKKQDQIDHRKHQLFALVFALISQAIIALLLLNRLRLRQREKMLTMNNVQLELERQQAETNQRLKLESWRNEFFTSISHELRTPLTLIQGPLERLLESAETDSKPLRQIHQNTLQLVKLVDQTLDLEKIDQGYAKLCLVPERIKDFIAGVVEPFHALNYKKHKTIEVVYASNNAQVMIDAEKLETILSNLIMNAFKHNPSPTNVCITINKPENELICLEISDNGSGIPEEDLPHIFDRFYQAHSANAGGSGIGLSLVKELVALHGGSIEVRSRINEGTTFSLTLSIQHEHGQKAVPFETNELLKNDCQHPGHVLEKPVAMIVEDHSEMLNYLTELMKPHYRVITATHGKEALEQASKQSVDLIISDVMMPGTNGMELTQILKHNIFTSHIPIILLTARATDRDRIKGLESGADAYITKPFNRSVLLTHSKNLIEGRRNLRRLLAGPGLKKSATTSLSKLDQDFISHATSIVLKHLSNEKLTVETFCSELTLNRTSVHLKLKALTGKSTSEFIRNIRVQKSAEFVRTKEWSMTEVAEMTGFANRQSFNKAFKQKLGVTPSEYARL